MSNESQTAPLAPDPPTRGFNAPSIFVPSTSAKLKISADEAHYLMTNPIPAIEKLMGLRLDYFQTADLKTAWRTPFVMDSGGVSASKSLRLWIISNLRCILIPDHVALIYYPFFGTGQNVFWGNYAKCASLSKLFASQIGQLDESGEKSGKGTLKKASSWNCYFRNGSQLRMPAGGFDRDSISQAGERCNFLGIDEFTKIESTGSTGIDDQLLDRNTRHCFNQNHPIWCNHLYFLATAEDTMHPAYDRYLVFKKEVERGNPNYALIARSFKDYSNKKFDQNKTHREMWRHDQQMQHDRKHRTVSRYLQENCGIWGKTGKGWYTREILDNCRKIGRAREVVPMVAQKYHHNFGTDKMAFTKFFAGIDPAKSETRKAADGSIVVGVAEPKGLKPTEDPNDWWFDLVYGYKVRNAEVDQWSGLIHRKESDFGLSMIVMDYGGGGDWVRGFLKRPKQMIRGQETNVNPIACIEDEPIVEMEARFILSMFKPKDEKIAKLYKDQTHQHESNLVDYGHQEWLTALSNGNVGLPQPRKLRDKEQGAHNDPEELQHANLMVDLAVSQLQRICVRTENDGRTYINGHHAREFTAKGRKDFAYAAMYSYMAFLCWLKGFEEEMWLQGEYKGGQCGGGGIGGAAGLVSQAQRVPALAQPRQPSIQRGESGLYNVSGY